MMSTRISMRQKRREAPEWIFPWRGLREAPLSKVAAVLITLGLFALLFVFVRIRVATPTQWAAEKASLIQVLDDADGRALTLRAREGGPFPSRFDPAELDWVHALEKSAYQAARMKNPPYEPALRALPEPTATAPRLSSPGKLVLPRHRPPPTTEPMPQPRSQPALYPLAGLAADDLPQQLPEFAADVPPAMAAEPWRFLLRLDPRGRVRDVISLAGSSDAGYAKLEAWLRSVQFTAADDPAGRWIAVGLGFTNHSDHGTDDH
jgi:hypothetical protein